MPDNINNCKDQVSTTIKAKGSANKCKDQGFTTAIKTMDS